MATSGPAAAAVVGLLALGLGSAGTLWALPFRVAPTFKVGHSPQTVATGDFNGDGKPDVATANAGTISILLNDGAGGFLTTTTEYGTTSTGLTIADFNGDGKRDLAVVSTGTSVAILLGDGAGGFASPVGYPTGGEYAQSLAAADLNGDTHPDLVVANLQSNQIAVLIGDGVGGFAAPVTYAVGLTPFFVAVADLNGDAKIDVAVVNINSGDVSVLLGDGNGGLTLAGNHTVGLYPYSVAVADLNGDGKPDLAVANQGSASVSLLLGDGAGGFGPAVSYPTSPQPISVAAADLDGDGRLDLAVGHWDDGVLILIGNGSGSFAWGTTFGTGSLAHVAVGDFNEYTRLDVVASTYSDTVSLLTGDGAGGLAAAPSFDTGNGPGFSLAAADFNGDGKLDLAAVADAPEVAILIGDGAGGLGPVHYYGPPDARLQHVATGDFNEDGKPDVVVACPSQNTIFTLLGDGLGGFGSAVSHGLLGVPQSVAVADFNKDGHADIAIANGGGGPNVLILLGDGSGDFAAPQAYSAGDSPWSIGVGDFNDDGSPDLAVVNYNSYKVAILLGDGAGAFALSTSRDVGPAPVSVVAGDFNGDGKLDVATANQNVGPNTVSVLFGDGSGGLGTATHYPAGAYAQNIVAHDLDGDGKLDLAVANLYTEADGADEVSIFLGDGSGGFSPAVNYGAGGAPRSLAVGDFNQDGKPDLAVANLGNVWLLLNSPVVANLSVRIDDGQEAAVLGRPQTYTITVKNNGPDDVVGAAVRDTLPAALTGSTWTCAASAGSHCAAAGSGSIVDSVDLLNGGTATYTITATIDPSSRLCVLNHTASVAAPQGIVDPVLGNNEATDVDDIVPVVLVRSARVREGNSGTRPVSFSVRLSEPSCRVVTVAYATSDGTAMAGSDYVAMSGVLTFPAWARSRAMVIPIIGDKLVEGVEFFFVNLTATNAAVAAPQTAMAIIDDDRN